MRLLVIELNEADADLLRTVAERKSLPALTRILSLNHTSTVAPETEEHVGLDPWVQWVSVHTGVPAAEHGVAHLGEAGRLQHPAYWERLGERGVRSLVWGPMNARRGHDACAVFVPDPWNGDEVAHPAELEPLLALPRYFAANYLSWSRRSLLRRAGVSGVAWLRHAPATLRRRIPELLRYVAIHRGASPALFTAHDVATAHLFADVSRTRPAELGVLFLNAIAHLQHHVWSERSVEEGPISEALVRLEPALQDVLDAWSDAELLVATGFSQRCRAGMSTKVLHRPHDHRSFLVALGIDAVRVQPLMTHDGHAWFASAAERDEAVEQLRAATLEGEALFDIRPTPDDDHRLFYQLVRWTPVPPGAQIRVGGRSLDFHTHVDVIDVRTGDHIPEGSVWSTLKLPESMPNHELARHIQDAFSGCTAGSPAGSPARRAQR